jgi:hypothetical protein
MSKPKTIKFETRLSKEASQPGGLTVEDALKRADASLETLRGPCEAAIDAALVQIESRFGVAVAARETERFEDLHRLAANIIDASIFARESGLDKAARTLCQLTGLCQARKAWDWIAVDLHINALRLLRAAGPSLGQSEREAVVEGLRQVTRKRVGDPDALPA